MMNEEFLLHLPFRDKRGFFNGLPGCVQLFGTFGAREMIKCLGVGGHCEIWSLVRFNVSLGFDYKELL